MKITHSTLFQNATSLFVSLNYVISNKTIFLSSYLKVLVHVNTLYIKLAARPRQVAVYTIQIFI